MPDTVYFSSYAQNTISRQPLHVAGPVLNALTGDVTFQGRTKRVFTNGDVMIAKLLGILIQHQGNPRERIHLIQALWDPGYGDDSSLRKLFSRLRDALEKAGPPFTSITIVGRGERPTLQCW